MFTLFKNASGEVEAKVTDMLACTMSRNYARNPELEKLVKIERSAVDFIFSIESVGQVPAVECFEGALDVLKEMGRGLADKIRAV